LLGCRGQRPYQADDNVDLALHQFSGYRRESARIPLRCQNFKLDVLPFGLAQLAKRLPECVEEVLGFGGVVVEQNPYPVDLPRLLRLGGQRRGEEYRTCAHEERAALHYSIT